MPPANVNIGDPYKYQGGLSGYGAGGYGGMGQGDPNARQRAVRYDKNGNPIQDPYAFQQGGVASQPGAWNGPLGGLESGNGKQWETAELAMKNNPGFSYAYKPGTDVGVIGGGAGYVRGAPIPGYQGAGAGAGAGVGAGAGGSLNGGNGAPYGAAGPIPYQEGAFKPETVDASAFDAFAKSSAAIRQQGYGRQLGRLQQDMADRGLNTSGVGTAAAGNLMGQQSLAENQATSQEKVARLGYVQNQRRQQFDEYAGQRGQGLNEWQAGDLSNYRNRVLNKSTQPATGSVLYKMAYG